MDYLEAEVPGWIDNDVRVAALFKGFSGQREDWQGRLDFWKALIVKLARHLDVFVVDAREVQQEWFLRGGLRPLCLNDVLHEMLDSGELQRMEEFLASSRPSLSGRILSSLGHALASVLGLQASQDNEAAITGKLVVSTLLKERASQLVQALAETSWKSECLLTIRYFVSLCGSVEEAQVLMHYLVVNRAASHLYVDGHERVEGLKISLVQAPVSPLSASDYNMLQLYWTKDKMQQRLDALEQQAALLRESAVTSVRSNDKQSATRYLKLKRITEASRDKCADFLERIHQIVEAISDAEATKKVTEAIQIGNRAMKEHHVTLDEVEAQLKELDESIFVEKQISEALAGASSVVGDGELEDELALLEAEMLGEEAAAAATEAAGAAPAAAEPVAAAAAAAESGSDKAKLSEEPEDKSRLNSAETSLEAAFSRMELLEAV